MQRKEQGQGARGEHGDTYERQLGVFAVVL
jgi:hypothetical protein